MVNSGGLTEEMTSKENWLEIVNLEKTTQSFKVELLSQQGKVRARNLVSSGNTPVKIGGRRAKEVMLELAAGVYQISITPSKKGTKYFAYLTQYALFDETYMGAVDELFSSGEQAQLLSLGQNKVNCAFNTASVEIGNAADKTNTVILFGKDSEGAAAGKITKRLAARNSQTVDVQTLLSKNATKVVIKGSRVILGQTTLARLACE